MHFPYNQLFYCLINVIYCLINFIINLFYTKTGSSFAKKPLALAHATFYDKSESAEQTIKALLANQNIFGYQIKSSHERLIHENKFSYCPLGKVNQGRAINFLMCSNKFPLTHFMPLDSFYTPWKHKKNPTFQMFLGGGGSIS